MCRRNLIGLGHINYYKENKGYLNQSSGESIFKMKIIKTYQIKLFTRCSLDHNIVLLKLSTKMRYILYYSHFPQLIVHGPFSRQKKEVFLKLGISNILPSLLLMSTLTPILIRPSASASVIVIFMWLPEYFTLPPQIY